MIQKFLLVLLVFCSSALGQSVSSEARLIGEVLAKPFNRLLAKEDIGMGLAGVLLAKGSTQHAASTYGKAINANLTQEYFQSVYSEMINSSLDERQQQEMLSFLLSPSGKNYLDAVFRSGAAVNSLSQPALSTLTSSDQKSVIDFFNSNTGEKYVKSSANFGNHFFDLVMKRACLSTKKELSASDWKSVAESLGC